MPYLCRFRLRMVWALRRGSQRGKATVFLRGRSTVSRDVTEGKGWEMKKKGDPGKRTRICGNFVSVFGRFPKPNT